MKQSLTVGAQLLWNGRYGYNNDCYGCAIVMSYTEINKAVSRWLLTFNMCNFTRGQFWPSGIVIAFVCVSVRVSVCVSITFLSAR